MNHGMSHQVAQDQPSGSAPEKSTVLRWHRRVLGVCLVIFALELGLFLLFFPWRRDWEMSWVPVHAPSLANIWMSPYFRGAISGLGLLNVGVAMAELYKQVRLFVRRSK